MDSFRSEIDYFESEIHSFDREFNSKVIPHPVHVKSLFCVVLHLSFLFPPFFLEGGGAENGHTLLLDTPWHSYQSQVNMSPRTSVKKLLYVMHARRG